MKLIVIVIIFLALIVICTRQALSVVLLSLERFVPPVLRSKP